MLGHITNTNARYISSCLREIGIRNTKQIAIPDTPGAIIDSINQSIKESDITILSGGLGPTVDDITLECISKALNKKLLFDKKVADVIRMHFRKRKIHMPKNNLRQAYVPEGAIPIINRVGTAPGLIIPLQHKVVMAFPGVPHELYPMFENEAVRYLKSHFPAEFVVRSRLIKITGLPESSVNEKIEDILRLSGNIEMGIYPHPEEIHVKITVTEHNQKMADLVINKIEKRIKNRLEKYIWGYDEEKLEEVVGRLLLKKRKTLAIAESCTGGLLASRITDVPGSSKYFLTGIVAYSNKTKNELLSVPLDIIKKYGAVSKKTAILMAENIRKLAKADFGIGITGIAGPGGGTATKPVGLVYIAISDRKRNICKEFHFIGERNIIKYKTTQAALNILRLYIQRGRI